MDLDEMKAMWQQHDKVLQQNKMLNEKLVHHLLQNKSKTAVQRMLNAEYFGIVFCGLLALVFLVRINTVTADAYIAISYAIITLTILASVGLSFYKVSLLKKIDLANGTVADIAQRVEHFKMIMSKERLWGIIGVPVLTILGIAVFMYWVTGQNVYYDFEMLVPQVIIGCIVGLAGMFFIYRLLYFDNIKEIKANLEEIKQFMD